ncbi:MAG: hypothetical protein Q4D98_03400 [Planctomycetia bacterium]|nr:hypothetical protein [Planctomycetia bacterium]
MDSEKYRQRLYQAAKLMENRLEKSLQRMVDRGFQKALSVQPPTTRGYFRRLHTLLRKTRDALPQALKSVQPNSKGMKNETLR